MSPNQDQKKNLVAEMEALVIKIGPEAHKHSADVNVKFAKLLILLSEDARELARHAITMHKRLVWLAWGALLFSVALLAVAVVQTRIMIKQDSDTNPHHVQAGQNQQAVSTNK